MNDVEAHISFIIKHTKYIETFELTKPIGTENQITV